MTVRRRSLADNALERRQNDTGFDSWGTAKDIGEIHNAHVCQRGIPTAL